MKGLDAAIEKAGYENAWFTAGNVRLSLQSVSSWLQEGLLTRWLETCPEQNGGKITGIIMAGNIPLVGFHDLLCTLLSGHKAEIKMSSSDKVLLPFITNWLISNHRPVEEFLKYTDRLKDYEAVIATGSNNSARYFEYYFGNVPHVIRKNRNSIAVLSGMESESDLKLLANDIFSYFGLGCRSVSKIMVPSGFDLNRIFASILPHSHLINHSKYVSNYDYQKAICMMNGEKILENGFLILRENKALQSAVATLHYEYYEDNGALVSRLQEERDNIQCVVSSDDAAGPSVPFGMSQFPAIDDYADGIDTMKFLSSF